MGPPHLAWRVFYEADLSPQQSAAPAHPRLPGAHADPLGARGHLGAPAQGAQETLGVNSGPDRRRETFSRDDRLRKRREFEECYASGVRVSGRHLQLFLLLPAGAGEPTARKEPSTTTSLRPRLGISVPRRVGGAVVRNRVRRRLREIFRRSRELFGRRGGDVVVNAPASASEATFAELAEEYRSLLAKSLSRAPENRGPR